MSLTITITDAGRQTLVNALSSGTAPVTITEIALGSGQYAPSASQGALASEFKRVDTISGEVVSGDTINVVLKDESSDDYQVGEFGLYTNTGLLFAVFSQASGAGWVAEKFAGSSFLLAVDVVLETLDATSLTFGDLTFTNPPASETVKGVIEIANNSEAWDGKDDIKAMTPKKTRMVGVPPGAVMTFPMAVAPAGYLKANGAAVSRLAYADLFSAIGTLHGSGNGTDTFNVPDLRGEFIRGWDDGRGVDVGRVIGSSQSDDNKPHAHGASSSEAGHHSHSGSASTNGGHDHYASASTGGGHSHSGSTNTTGAHTHTKSLNNSVSGGTHLQTSGGYAQGSITSTDSAGAHAHSFTTLKSGDHNHAISVSAAGSHGHALNVVAAGSHAHSITVNSSGGSESRPRNKALLTCIKY